MPRNLRTTLRTGLAAFLISGLLACTTTPLPPLAPLPPPVAPPPPPAVVVPPPAPPAAFMRPSAGSTIARFDGRGNKGIDIAGEAGDPVLASADGRVAYVGSELRGYGTMVIVQHNETFITAYAHVQRALVREKDVVVKGQKIAEMGMTGTDRVKLHFELRKQGVAVDPEPYLQGRLR